MKLLLSALMFSTWAHSAAGPHFSLSAKTIRQGRTALLRIQPAPNEKVPQDLALHFGDQKITLWDCGKDGRCGVLAVPLDTQVGKAAIDAAWGDKKDTIAFTVKKGKFLVNKLKVDPSITNPSEEEKKKIEQDKADFATAYSNPLPTPLWEGAFQSPTHGGVTSLFGNQRTYNGEVKSTHFGVDIKAAVGDPIYAANKGKVLLAKGFFLAGNMVLLDHGCGNYTNYAHLSAIMVSPGQIVDKGEMIGRAGATGRVTGPHLHWGGRANGVPVDPQSLTATLNRSLEPAPKPVASRPRRKRAPRSEAEEPQDPSTTKPE